MRRFAALLAVLIALTGLAASTQAVTRGGLHWVERDWQFHTSTDVANGASYASGDSFWVYRGTGLENSDEQKDTTKAIAWADWALPPPFSNNAASDTLAILLVDVYPVGTSPTVAGDTLGVTMQVSDDNGATWTTCAATGPRMDVDASTVAMGFLETGTSNSFHCFIEQLMGGATLGGPLEGTNASQGTPLAYNTYGYQYFRLILRGDHTGQYRIRLRGWQYDD